MKIQMRSLAVIQGVMPFSQLRRLLRLYNAHSAWLGKQLTHGFPVRIAEGTSVPFPGFRRPVELQSALLDTFEDYLRRSGDRAVPQGEATVSACRAMLLESAHAVVRGRLMRALEARSVFEWPLTAAAGRGGSR